MKPVIEFDEAAHTYSVNGQRKPSVTQILKPLVDFSMINPDVLEAKSALGRRVHLATELDDDGSLDESSVGDDVAPYLAGWRQFKEDTGALVLMSEQRVYHPGSNYCGTLDRVLAFAGNDWLIDIKSSTVVHKAVGPQTAAYLEALAPGRPMRRGVVQLRPDGTYRLRELESPRDWVTFQACNLIYRFNLESQHV